MRGRTLFNLSKPGLIILANLLRFLPINFAALVIVLIRHIPTKLGIALRYILLQRLAKQCGDCVAIFEGSYLFGLSEAEFGDNVSIHEMCYIDAQSGLKIGSNVSIAHGTTIMTTEHDFSQPDQNTRDTPCIMLPVTIGNDVWIGAGVRILAGVTIGDHVVIGAGAVVTKDIPSYKLAVGVPARCIKSIKEQKIGSHTFV